MTFNYEKIGLGLQQLEKGPASDQIQLSGCAAVLVPLIHHNGVCSLLLTQRAFNMRHHGGEVAFPGGMWELGDNFPLGTALREAQEEVLIKPEDVDVLGLLPAVYTRQGTKVTPVVSVIHTLESALVASPAEINSIFIIPLAQLMPECRVRTDIFLRSGEQRWAPAYHYQGYDIWGMTAGVIKELLIRCFQYDFPQQHHSPEKLWE